MSVFFNWPTSGYHDNHLASSAYNRDHAPDFDANTCAIISSSTTLLQAFINF